MHYLFFNYSPMNFLQRQKSVSDTKTPRNASSYDKNHRSSLYNDPTSFHFCESGCLLLMYVVAGTYVYNKKSRPKWSISTKTQCQYKKVS